MLFSTPLWTQFWMQFFGLLNRAPPFLFVPKRERGRVWRTNARQQHLTLFKTSVPNSIPMHQSHCTDHATRTSSVSHPSLRCHEPLSLLRGLPKNKRQCNGRFCCVDRVLQVILTEHLSFCTVKSFIDLVGSHGWRDEKSLSGKAVEYQILPTSCDF